MFNIHQHVRSFERACQPYLEHNYTTILDHCLALQSALAEEALHLKASLEKEYKTRNKRSLPMVMGAAKLARSSFPFIKRYGMEMLLGAGLMYQTKVNSDLDNKITQLEKKTLEVGELLVDLNDIRFKDVDTKIHDLLENQQIELVMEKIVDFTKERHEAAASLTPTDELVKQAELFKDSAQLPNVSGPEEWFGFNKPSKEIDRHGMIVVNFVIPLVKPEKFSEFVAISIPSEEEHPEIHLASLRS